MATSQPPPPSPAGRPDQDDRPSIKVLMAASMLRRGRQPLDVANATSVPLALIELIATEHHPALPGRPEPPWPGGATAWMPETPPLASEANLPTPDLLVQQSQIDASRWAIRICCAAALVVVGDVCLAAVAAITHSFTVAMAAVILTLFLLIALGLCAVGCAYAARGRLPRPL
jgi:hypothetical protein